MEFFDILGKTITTTAKVATGVVSNLAVSAGTNIADACKVVGHVSRGELGDAGDMVLQKIDNTVTGLARTAGSACDLACDMVRDPSSITDRENVERLTQIATLGAAVATPCILMDDDITANADSGVYYGVPSDELMASNWGLSPDAIENGTFVGGPSDLTALAEQGQIEGTTHIDSSEIVRDIGARDDFLAAHGFAGVPDGYEVHHVQPLSEGGADTPENMILISEEDHDRITAMHRAYYGWNA